MLVLCNSSARSQSTSTLSSLQRETLLAARETLWKSWYRNDQARLKELVPEDMIAINRGDGEWESRAAFLAGATSFADHHGRLLSLIFPKTSIQAFGKVAVLYSLYQVRYEYDGYPQYMTGRSTEIFILKNGHWISPGWHLDSGK